MGNRARPFAVRVKVGAKMGTMYHTGTTSRNGVGYYWYSNADKTVEIIRRADHRPPDGIDLESLVQIGAASAWRRTLERGSKAKTLSEAWEEEQELAKKSPPQK